MYTREKIRQFSYAFGRPVNTELTSLSVTDRELLCKLLLEETLEYIEASGFGVQLNWGITDPTKALLADLFVVKHVEGLQQNPVEMADALGDINVVIHFNAHWQGFNLDRVTDAIHASNMSKLDDEGSPIINGLTPGYRYREPGVDPVGDDLFGFKEAGYDSTKPMGKILKSRNYRPPTDDIKRILEEGNH